MADALRYDYRRYLAAKRSVDDRSLNQHVLSALRAQISQRAGLRVLEIGGGIGTMVQRSIDKGLLTAPHYTLVDIDRDSLDGFSEQTRSAAAQAGYTIDLVHADIGEFLASNDQHYDLVIANAVLDLLDLTALLSQLAQRCVPNALLWFTINFDGESCFLPASDQDEAIWHAYHQSMNRPPGCRYAGRSLLQTLLDRGAILHATGSSDWIVHPAYREDQAYFLHHIVHTIDKELRGDPPLAAGDFRQWIDERHRDIAENRLVYIAHQIDVLSSRPNKELF